MRKNLVYIVMCECLLEINGDERYHIDSVWTSERKAEKRKNELNSSEKKEFREDYGYGLFGIEYQVVSK